MYRQSENMFNSIISSIRPHNMVNFGPVSEFGAPQQISTGLASWLHYSLLHRHPWMEVNQTLHDVWPSHGLAHNINIFGGSCSLTEFCQVQKFTLRPSLAFFYWQRYCTAFEQWATVKLRRGTRKGITELSILVCAIPTAAITLGIGPHSSWC